MMYISLVILVERIWGTFYSGPVRAAPYQRGSGFYAPPPQLSVAPLVIINERPLNTKA